MSSGSNSLIPKTPEVITRNAKTGLVSNTFGGKIGFAIDRADLLSEIALKITVSAAFAVAPTSVDVRQFIERISVKTTDGEVISSLSGQQLLDMCRLTEVVAAARLTPGAGAGAVGNVVFFAEIHNEMDGAYFDFLTAVKSGDLSKYDVEITLASLAKMQAKAFVGSTFSAAPLLIFNVDVENHTFPAMNHRADVAKQIHFTVNKELSGASTGRQTIELDPSCLMRFVGLHVDDVSAGSDLPAPSDTIVTNIILRQGNRVLHETDFISARANTQQKRDVNVVGFCALDWNDYEEGFAGLTDEPVFLQFDVAVGAPAWRVQVAQDYKKDRISKGERN